MATINRARISRQLVPGLNAIFGTKYKDWPEQHTQIFKMESSQREYEEELKTTGMGLAPVKKEGAGVVYDAYSESYRVRYYHDTIALGYEITEEALEDNLYFDRAKGNTEMLARSMAQTKQFKAAAILDRAFNPTYPGGDSVSLANTAHPLLQGSFSNALATPAQLNETSLENAVIQMQGWFDDRGLLINAAPRVIIVPRQLQFQITRLLQTPLRPGTSANDINALREMGIFSEGFKVNNYLSNPTQWHILTDVPNGLKGFTRVPLSYGNDEDFDTGNFRYKARERYCFYWSDPAGILSSQGV